jgi:two-component system, OmpR family, KDP operon response regulator KdpE
MHVNVGLVEADPGARRLLRRQLDANGYTVVGLAAGGNELDHMMSRQNIHLLLLDDPALCAHLRLRWPRLPLIIVSTVTEEREIVRALDVGADDYLTRPFDQDEFLARIRAHLRRARMTEEGVFWTPDQEVLRSQDGTMTLDVARRQVHVREQEVRLSSQECALLRLLMLHQGRVVPQRTLLQQVWGPAYTEEANYLRVYMRQLRRKLEPEPAHPRYLHTEPRIGYVFSSPLS